MKDEKKRCIFLLKFRIHVHAGIYVFFGQPPPPSPFGDKKNKTGKNLDGRIGGGGGDRKKGRKERKGKR